MNAVLRPHRSLSPAGFFLLMAVVIGVAFSSGMFYLLVGAWPVLIFMLVDAALVFLAFRLSYAQARAREHVRVTPSLVHVMRRCAQGREAHWTMTPAWARVSITRPITHDSQVELSQSGRCLVLGAFLSPDERGAFADALKAALSATREPRPIN